MSYQRCAGAFPPAHSGQRTRSFPLHAQQPPKPAQFEHHTSRCPKQVAQTSAIRCHISPKVSGPASIGLRPARGFRGRGGAVVTAWPRGHKAGCCAPPQSARSRCPPSLRGRVSPSRPHTGRNPVSAWPHTAIHLGAGRQLRRDRYAASYGHPPHGRHGELSPFACRAVGMVSNFPVGRRHGLGHAGFTGDFAGLGESGACHAPLDSDRFESGNARYRSGSGFSVRLALQHRSPLSSTSVQSWCPGAVCNAKDIGVVG